ncbi:MAG: serine/threonine protein kinase, partial [Actinomycetota bacterium]|nr:serine/threonine protein kinase [Actinomycetota bacterium]
SDPKAVCLDPLDDRRTRHGLIREGRLLERLTHPHIVRAYETIEQPHPILILETLTGATLAHLIDNSRRRLPLSDIVHLGLHLCSAIHYLHRRGILNLKPSNIVSERQLAKVLDLSVARPPGKEVKGVGTANYMSPEQARGDALGPAADVWGIGVVLFEAAGEEPFDAYDDETRYEQFERRAESIRSHRRVPPPSRRWTPASSPTRQSVRR